MKQIITTLLTIVLLASCSAGKQVSVTVSNSLGIDRANELVEVSKNTIWSSLNLKASDRIVVLDDAARAIERIHLVGSPQVTARVDAQWQGIDLHIR